MPTLPFLAHELNAAHYCRHCRRGPPQGDGRASDTSLWWSAECPARLRAALDAAPGLLAVLPDLIGLVRVKFGNRDPDVNATLTLAEAAIAKAKGGAA